MGGGSGGGSGTASPSRRLSFEGDSFSRFTVEMVRQYMHEEEIRAQHQVGLLILTLSAFSFIT